MIVNTKNIKCYTMFKGDNMKTDTQIGIRVTSQLEARLEAQAEKENRSVANLVKTVMEQYLDMKEKEERFNGK